LGFYFLGGRNMRDIKGKSLKKIADELGYSYQYIKEISARNKIYQEPTGRTKLRITRISPSSLVEFFIYSKQIYS
jgi:hypothetical protein